MTAFEGKIVIKPSIFDFGAQTWKICRMFSWARTIFFSCLFVMGATGRAELTVKKVDRVDYSWVQGAYFSTDESRLDTRILIKVDSTSKLSLNATLYSFIEGLNDPHNQRQLKQTYNLTNETYLVLAKLALGIMYAESKFASDRVYQLKERFPWSVSIAKKFLDRSKFDFDNYKDTYVDSVRGLSLEYYAQRDHDYDARDTSSLIFDLNQNSRGPTQIKFLPKEFEKAFPHINKNNLHIAQNSAVATIAYLADKISNLKQLAENGKCEIPRDHFLYYLLYIYVGRPSEISKCRATLDRNLYWRRAIEMQPALQMFTISPKHPSIGELSKLRSSDPKLKEIGEEIKSRQALVDVLEDSIKVAEQNRDAKIIFRQEDVNQIVEYLLAAGFTVGSHKALKAILPSKAAWAAQRSCKKIILGRKRYFALLHGFNTIVLAKLIKDPKFGLDQIIEVDADKKMIDELKASLDAERASIKRMQLDFEIRSAALGIL